GEEPGATPDHGLRGVAFKPLDDPVPFFLRAPEPQDDPDEALDDDAAADDEAAYDDETRGRDLFDPAADELETAEVPAPEGAADEDGHGDGVEGEAEHHRGRTIIDDSAPYDFVPAPVQPLPRPAQGGVLTLVALAALGLIFFGGGIFWATNARAVASSAWLGPKLVGGLAGVAGVGFFVVAIYFLLERLGRASERRARSRR
ncbi:MAG TPA: hypothetical protein VGH86_13880, partial [Phenylobacterium sp.]